MSAIATYLTQSGKRRLFRGHTGETQFSETRETVFFDLRTAEDKGMMALKMLLVRVDLTGIGFVLGVTEATVLTWLKWAAHQADMINRPLLRALPVTQGQLDEMWHCIERQPACETDAAGASVPGGEDGRQWIWISFAPEFRLMIAAIVGPRTLDTAKEVVAVTKARVAGIPACFSDGFTCSLAALIAACHVVTTCARTGKRGRPRKPRCEPHPALVYGQLVKQKKQGKLLTRSTRVVLGAERLRQRVVFFQAFSNVARPHMSLRQPLPLHERTRHGAIRPRWRECTPALAAGLTDHVWTFRELLTAKFEPLDSQSISG